MTKKEKFIAWAGVTIGTIIGTNIGILICEYSLSTLFLLFFSIFGIIAMAIPVIAVLIELRNEKRKRNRSANWGFDKRFEL